MTSFVLRHIGSLVTNRPEFGTGRLGVLTDAAVVVEDGLIAWVGGDSSAPTGTSGEEYDVAGRAVIPGFVDSHGHLVFGGDREGEFAARMSGIPYSAGGIASTVEATRRASDDELRAVVTRLTAEALAQGTTTIECKSGYGLTTHDESRSLRLAGEVTSETTYLGAQVVAPESRHAPDDYVELVVGEMLDACAPLARWIDVFCDRGAFDVDQARTILAAGHDKGLGTRLHAGQLELGGGVRLGVEMGAASVDHCTHLDHDDVEALASSPTVATLLPGAEFSTRSAYAPARRLLDAGATVALAADCNPGSSYTTSMAFCIAVAVRDLHMTPEEALWSATAGGAQALRRNDIGQLGVGSRADLVVLDAPSYVHLAYRPGVPLAVAVWQAGVRRR